MYNARNGGRWLEWISFGKLKSIEKVAYNAYTATWLDGRALYDKQDDGSWKKRDAEPVNVFLRYYSRTFGAVNILLLDIYVQIFNTNYISSCDFYIIA